jgi:hypothetical protein
MSLDLPNLIETAADEVASVGRAAAGSLNELVHDWGHETRSFVSDHTPSLPIGGSRKRGHSPSMVRLLLPIAVLAVVALVIMRRRRPHASPHLPERNQQHDHIHETVVGSAPKDKRAEGAAAS